MDVRPKWHDGTPAHTIKKLHVVNRYNLAVDRIPIMTLRKQFIKGAIDEILWIYQKHSNVIDELNSHVWDDWNVGDGTIGKAYGYQIAKISKHHKFNGHEELGRYPSAIVMSTYDAKIKGHWMGDSDKELWVWMNQIDAARWDLRNNPGSRSIITTMYCPEDLADMGLRPCAFQMHYLVTKDDEGNPVLNAALYQRSQDMLTANNWNVIQYAALTNMLAIEANMKVGKFTHFIADAHIYDRHIPLVQELLDRFDDAIMARSSTGRPFTPNDLPHANPTVWINPEKHDFYDFVPEDFRLENYEYEPFDHKIEVAV